MAYRLAIFDFDGTLADSFPWFLRVVNDAADRYGFRRIRADEVEALRGLDARRIIRHVGLPLWKVPLVARHMRARMAAEIDQITLFPGVDALLPALAARGIAIAVVTSNSAENVRRVLGPRNTALVQHFGCGASLFGKGPRLRQALRAFGVAPADALCIGDEVRDLRAAHAERIPFGAVSWGYTSADALRANGAHACFVSTDEILRALAPAGPHVATPPDVPFPTP